ncbi:hypothetical protein niasHS_009334 [Heterodera schachtii]|uniref:Uncharacterized protein n=1 Tax=Heterodera schachtii TaxID=97005 RepID=A0ABD2JBQ5_HETSC
MKATEKELQKLKEPNADQQFRHKFAHLASKLCSKDQILWPSDLAQFLLAKLDDGLATDTFRLRRMRRALELESSREAERSERSICFTTRYPLGHPKDACVERGCKLVQPSRQPLPFGTDQMLGGYTSQAVKVGERLCFPLCFKCAKDYPTGWVNEYHCQHNDQRRSWVNTSTSIELNATLEEGYHVTKVFSVLEYEQSDDQLFRPCIGEFMAQKIQASGFDS